ncbi:MAG: acyl-CoA thioesterase [Acidobacteria bacterium]|nr:acyl-CoA thioesterase [Acidobacteriota bacterium]
MVSCQARLRARYAETDQMGVIHHSVYLVWLEMARVDYCRAAGFDYGRMEREDGILMVVVETHCRYVHPTRFDDEVLIDVRIQEAHPRLVRFAYEVRRASDSRLLVSAETRHVFCNRAMRPTRLPPQYWPLFGIGE